MSCIWDDSALINAFNSSLTKYQEMHGLAHNSSGTVKCSPEEDETDRSITTEETCTITVSKQGRTPQVIKSMPLDNEVCTSEKSYIEPSGQATPAKHSHVNTETGSAGDKDLQTQDSKCELFCQIQQLEQQNQLLQEKVNHLYSFMNTAEVNYGSSNGFPQPPTQSDGISCEGPYGGLSHHYPHYHWGFYPHPLCSWHNNIPVTTPATFPQSSQPLAKDHAHVFAEAPHNISSAHAQASSTPVGISADVVAEVVKDAICKCSSSLPGISAQASIGAKSSENLPGDKSSIAFAELLSVWFNAGFQTARYLLEKPG